jgi:hypothetical protein
MQSLTQDKEGIVANGVRYKYKDLGVDPNNVRVFQTNGRLFVNGKEVTKGIEKRQDDGLGYIPILLGAVAGILLAIWKAI